MDRIIVIQVKAVPGASRDEVVGWLGDQLKVRVSAPPEGGKANKAICKLLANELGVKPAAATVTHGMSSPVKSIAIVGVDAGVVERRWPRNP